MLTIVIKQRESTPDVLKKIISCIIFKQDKIKSVELYVNATARYFDQMTGINNNRCYLKLFFIKKYFENNT